jgi:Mn-dependent DtxR family transcriptional regulator
MLSLSPAETDEVARTFAKNGLLNMLPNGEANLTSAGRERAARLQSSQ